MDRRFRPLSMMPLASRFRSRVLNNKAAAVAVVPEVPVAPVVAA